MAFKPLPGNKKQFFKEAGELGLLNPNVEFKANKGRKYLLWHAYKSYEIGRSYSQASILIVGPSGVGKSTTFNHLFNLRQDESIKTEHAAVDDKKSCTDHTTEYVISVDSEIYEVGGLILGLVDTPGIADPNGQEQDICNIYSMQRFYQTHPNMTGCYPNLIFVTVNAVDTRLVGSDSNLMKSMKCLRKLNLLDKSHPNVICIMTNVAKLARKREKWIKAVEEKKTLISDILRKSLNLSVDVVAIENDLEELDEKGEWTLLPDDETCQPLNLFQACVKLFKQNGDKFGHLIFNECFAKASNPTKGFEVKANDASKEGFEKGEKELCDSIFVKESQGSRETSLIMEEANLFIEKNGLDHKDRREIDDVTSLLGSLGFVGKDPLKYIDVITLNTLLELSDNQKSFLSHLGVREKALQNNKQILGQGYNIYRDRTAVSEIFKFQTKNMLCGIPVPMAAKVNRVSDTITIMDVFKNAEEMINARMNHLNISIKVDVLSFSTACRPGYNWQESSKSTQSLSEYSFLIEQRLFEFQMPSFDEVPLSADFVRDVQQLPDGYSTKDESNAFKRFFEKWGYFVVSQVYCGGSIELKIKESTCSKEQLSIQDLKSELMIAFGGVGGFGAEGTKMSSSVRKIDRILNQVNIHWKGGNLDYHKPCTLTDSESFAKWKLSLMNEPSMLEHELSLTPIYEIVGKVNKEKMSACMEALERQLGGKQVKHLKAATIESLCREAFLATRKTAAHNPINLPDERDGSCFPSYAVVTVLDGGKEKKKLMKQLKIGDSVKTFSLQDNSYFFTPVVTFLHIEPSKLEKFRVLTMCNGSTLTLTDNHLIMIKGKSTKIQSARASDIKVGEKRLIFESGINAEVRFISYVNNEGIYCPLTVDGTMIVDGVYCSCYASTVNFTISSYCISGHQIAHFAVTPLRLWKRIARTKEGLQVQKFHPYIAWLRKSKLAKLFLSFN